MRSMAQQRRWLCDIDATGDWPKCGVTISIR
jgi:hypothetical protein